MYVSRAKRDAANEYLASHNTKEDRKFISRMLNEGQCDPIQSMIVENHSIGDEDGTITYFGLYYFDETYTKEEIDEFFNDLRVELRYSDYDCTGCLFTTYMHWHTNPCGLVSLVHRLCLDI